MNSDPNISTGSFYEKIKWDSKNGDEYWLARELQEAVGYSRWNNFARVVERAKTACTNSGGELTDHFTELLSVSIKSGKRKRYKAGIARRFRFPDQA